MPASRSRTDRWRDCLAQVYERSGALEISVDRQSPEAARGAAASETPFPGREATGPQPGPHSGPHSGQHAGPRPEPQLAGTGDADGRTDLVWRVRILSLTESEIVVEQPVAAGQVIPIRPGVRLVAGMSIGQNRWMFHTHALPAEPSECHRHRSGDGRPNAAQSLASPDRTRCHDRLRLAMPTRVERCQRRNFYRISTAELCLPRVECWPLLDPATVIAAEVANRAQIRDAGAAGAGGEAALHLTDDDTLILPEVGPRLVARLMNVGGGGAGLMISRDDAQALDRSRLFWLRINLTPWIPLPLGITARLAHTHFDSEGNLYAGMAFDWSFHPAHRDFVVEQIARYVAAVQQRQAA